MVENVFSFGYWGVSRVISPIIFALNVITHWIIRISIWNFRITLIYALYTNHEVIVVENVFSFGYWGVSRVISPIIFALNVITHWIIRISIWNFRITLIYALYTNHEVIVVENVFSFGYWGVSRVISPIIFALNVITHWIIWISIWNFRITLIYALYTNHEVIVVENVFSFGYWGVSRVISPIIFALNVITHWIIWISIWNFRNTIIYALYTNHQVIVVENVFSFGYWGVSRVISPIIFALNVITHWIIRISIWNFRITLIYALYTNHEVIVVENVFSFGYWGVSRVISPIIFALNVITHWIIRISIWNFRITLIYALYTNHEVIVVENVFSFGYWGVSRVISPIIFALNVITHWIIRISL